MKNSKLRLLIIFLGVTLSTLLLDRLFFDYLIFTPENRSGWDQFRWYNFEYNFRQIEKRRRAHPRKKLILLVGSSIAKYSLQPAPLREELRKHVDNPGDYQIEALFHASLLPHDLSYYAPRIARLNPSLVVYITNPADLDLERYLPPWEAGPVYSDEAAANYMRVRLPLKLYYPGAYAWRESERLELSELWSFFLQENIKGLRYRNEWFDPLLYNRRAERKELKSYLYYQGKPIAEGLFRNGQTGSCFTLNLSDLKDDSLLLELPGLLQSEPDFVLEYWFEPQNTKAPQTDLQSGVCPEPPPSDFRRYQQFFSPGWHRLKNISKYLKCYGSDNCTRISFRLSHVISDQGKVIRVNAKSPSFAGAGLRLPGNFGLSEPRRNDYLVRRPDLEGLQLLNLTALDYTRNFESRISPSDWRAEEQRHLHQFNYLQLAKYYLNWYQFEPTFQLQNLERFIDQLSDSSQVLVINNPENPLTFATYGESNWYRGYRNYYQKLSAEHTNLLFRDLTSHSRLQHFSDTHHLTYPGQQAMLPRYARTIAQILKTEATVK